MEVTGTPVLPPQAAAPAQPPVPEQPAPTTPAPVQTLADVLEAAQQKSFDLQRAAQLGIEAPAPTPLAPPAPQATPPASPTLDLQALSRPENLHILEAVVNHAKAQRPAPPPDEPKPPAEPDWNAARTQLRTQLLAEYAAKFPEKRVIVREPDELGEMKERVEVQKTFNPDDPLWQETIDLKLDRALQGEREKYLRSVNEFNRSRTEKAEALRRQAEENRMAKAFDERVSNAMDAFIAGNMVTADQKKTSEFVPRGPDGKPAEWFKPFFGSIVDGVKYSADFNQWAEQYATVQQQNGQSHEAIQRGIVAAMMGEALKRARPALTASAPSISVGSTVPGTPATTATPVQQQSAIPTTTPTAYPSIPAAPATPAKPPATERALQGGVKATAVSLQDLAREAAQRMIASGIYRE